MLLALSIGEVASPISIAPQFPFKPAVAATPTRAATLNAKLQPFLQQLAVDDARELVRVIVQHNGAATKIAAAVTALEGTVVNELSFINALVVKARAGVLPALAELDAVLWVALDAPVHKSSATDGSSTNVRDDFAAVSFAGSSGAFPWSAPWAEIGESNGPVDGNVAVTSFWGGALQGLRLQGSAMGAARALDLTGARGAHLGLAYRRKDFRSDQDYVALEASHDEGLSWQEIARLGPLTLSDTPTDAEIQYANYDLTAHVGGPITLRLVTAPTMSGDASFYVDAIDLHLDFAAGVDVPQTHKVYLPLVATDDSNSRSKADNLARLDQGRALCVYFCIDLALLGSTYVKAIGADRIWNSSPYIRGDGVGVAVVDSGIAPHPDLHDYYGFSRIVKQVNFVPQSTVPDDFYGHGTHIAGTIAGNGSSSTGGYIGVAPEAKIIDVKVTDDYGMGNTSDVVAGLQWVYNNRVTYNIKIVNLSLNSTVPESYHQSALDAALEVLWFNKIVVVVSAGNGGKEKLFPPANDPFAIVVGSMDDRGTADLSDDRLSSFSAYGMTVDGFTKPDIVAPGQGIVSLLASDDMNLKKNFPAWIVNSHNNRYFKMSGTSMAAAVVAGATALLLEDEPGLTPDQVKYRLLSTARPVIGPQPCSTGVGYLDIYAALYATTTRSSNTGVRASQLLWSGTNPTIWGSVSWNSVSWNSVSWNSVSWNSVSWNSVSWNSNSGTGVTSEPTGSSCTGAFTNLTLVNALTDSDVQPLYHGVVIDLDVVGTPYITVRADTTGAVQSVKFDANNGVYTKIENAAPYALYGDNSGNYAASAIYPGQFLLKVLAYAADNLAGALLDLREYQGLIISSSYLPTIRSGQSAFCLQPSSGGSASGLQLEQSSCSATTYQKFRIKVVAGKPDAVNLINANNGLCIDISGASNSNNATALQWSCSGSGNQQFRLKVASSGLFNLVAVHSGKCLALLNNNLVSGTKLVQASCNEDAGQQWRFE